MITPPSLHPGDLIGIVAPAGIADPDKVRKGIETLEKAGFRIKSGKHLFDSFYRFSSTDENRLSDLQEQFDDEEVRAVFAARGGYGIARIIDHLSLSRFRKHPKWFVGFSDLCMLHAMINNAGFESIHGPMASHLSEDLVSREALTKLFEILGGNGPLYSLATHPLSRTGAAAGELAGGNLSVLCTNTGTSTDLNTRGKILIIEDLNEYHYHIDRMMMQLKRSGKLSHLAGLIVGDFTSLRDEPELFGMNHYEIILNAVSEYDYPVLFGFPAGHDYDNRPLIFGREIKIDIHSNKTIVKQ